MHHVATLNRLHETQYNTSLTLREPAQPKPFFSLLPFFHRVYIYTYIYILAGLPGFARDSCSIMMSICAFHFYIIYFHFSSADHGIPQTFYYILTT